MLQQMLKRKDFFPRSRINDWMWYDLLVLRYSNTINNVIAFFCIRIRCNFTELIITDYTTSTAFHLRIKNI